MHVQPATAVFAGDLELVLKPTKSSCKTWTERHSVTFLSTYAGLVQAHSNNLLIESGLLKVRVNESDIIVSGVDGQHGQCNNFKKITKSKIQNF